MRYAVRRSPDESAEQGLESMTEALFLTKKSMKQALSSEFHKHVRDVKYEREL